MLCVYLVRSFGVSFAYKKPRSCQTLPCVVSDKNEAYSWYHLVFTGSLLGSALSAETSALRYNGRIAGPLVAGSSRVAIDIRDAHFHQPWALFGVAGYLWPGQRFSWL